VQPEKTMPLLRFVIVACLLVESALAVADEAPRTVGELQAKGGVQLDRQTMLALISGAVVSGESLVPGTRYELAYAPDGAAKGYIGSSSNSAVGTWEITERGKLCSVLRDATNREHRTCVYWFQLGGVTYSSPDDAPASPEYQRDIRR
jgi:hypothetical protein